MHEQNMICSKTQNTYLEAAICRSSGGLSANEKEGKNTSNDKCHLLVSYCCVRASKEAQLLAWRRLSQQVWGWLTLIYELWVKLLQKHCVTTNCDARIRRYLRCFRLTLFRNKKTNFYFWKLHLLESEYYQNTKLNFGILFGQNVIDIYS